MCDYTPVDDGTLCGRDAGTCQTAMCTFPCTYQGILDAISAGGGPNGFTCEGPTTVEGRFYITNDVILDGGGLLTIDGQDIDTVFLIENRATVEAPMPKP